jgi:hypothetical protein
MIIPRVSLRGWQKDIKLTGSPRAYFSEYPQRKYVDSVMRDSAYVLFVVQPNERNVFDQRLLEYELLESCVIFPVQPNLL